ncbi:MULTISPECIES: ribonuclease Y [Anaerococcus]|uniref:ribonuclease Y n=1 Tax=Anaerococcus TaxID=165779 RepID=UPI0008A62EBF|nr:MULTISPECIES: ribonuclease Y [Anaerococcus]MDU5460454.1 ribonuclease Y [Anaerococcus vaginalis]MDU5823576.1 ribonuclease Y [Anaerococcus vaginalis]MDU5987928.1 ribonuclease Y [Anaerococcus vaginalis]MDU7142254.1 ribonuclease Y [Anaerococcus vaginalis]MDU7649474.1 ribonuclease Y [Anaerococcus vaginalis]
MNFNQIILSVAFIILAFFIGYLCRKKIGESKISSAEELSARIIDEANRDAESLKKDALISAKDEISKRKKESEQEINKKNNELATKEGHLLKKEESLDKRSLLLDKKSDEISSDQKKLKQKEDRIEKLIEEQELKLQDIAGLTTNEAKDILLQSLKNDVVHEQAKIIKEFEEKTKNESKKLASEILATTIQRYAADEVAESTVTVVSLPNDEMKGRIIGREGRNIRAFEQLSGTDMIIDDTPEAVVISAFEPIRREIAKVALERLILDGRINPSRIEEMLMKAEDEVEQRIIEDGQRAIEEVGIHNLHPQLVRLVGKLKFRTSYGQNVLKHSIEVAKIAGMLAQELGLDDKDAKRGGLLHDLGKAIDHEVEGTHISIGVEAAKKYGENKNVINCIESHHGDVEANCIAAILVQASDTISAARPGARRESLENYIKRLENLEEIANSFDGIEKTFAVQAGRELRVMIKPEKISDDQMVVIAREIAQKIENELEYPGQIKVNVIRESKAIEYAK